MPEDMKLGHQVWVNLLADFRVNRVPPTPNLSIQIAFQRAEQVGQLLPIAVIGATIALFLGKVVQRLDLHALAAHAEFVERVAATSE